MYNTESVFKEEKRTERKPIKRIKEKRENSTCTTVLVLMKACSLLLCSDKMLPVVDNFAGVILQMPLTVCVQWVLA